jgi:hypothetical protein
LNVFEEERGEISKASKEKMDNGKRQTGHEDDDGAAGRERVSGAQERLED